MRHRFDESISPWRNVATVEFSNGKRLAFESDGKGIHAEEEAMAYAKLHGLKIKKMFTDKTPCAEKRNGNKMNCWDKVMTDEVFSEMEELRFLSDVGQDNFEGMFDSIFRRMGLYG